MTDNAPDPEYLRYQYSDPEKLRIRGESHARYSERAQRFSDWMLPHIAASPGQLLVDVGCGYGGYHRLSRLGVRIIGLDASFGMVREVLRRARREALPALTAQALAEALPLPGGCADRVMANHVLYHVPDPRLALCEMRRVLRVGGRATLATNARDTMRRLVEVHAAAARELGYTPIDIAPERRFSLDDLPLVRSVFPKAECHAYDDAFLFPSTGAAVRYYASAMIDWIQERPPENAHRARLARSVATHIEAIIGQEGVFRVPKRSGCFVGEV